MSKSIIQKGFILAGLVNILGILGFSRFFTNEVMNQTDPVVMSNFGLIMICVWGLLYIVVAKDYEKIKWVVAVFAIEKLAYVLAWIFWISKNSLSSVFDKDLMAGLFYSVYGANDFLFMLFFILVFLKIGKQ